jgi:hypothetical protein
VSALEGFVIGVMTGVGLCCIAVAAMVWYYTPKWPRG